MIAWSSGPAHITEGQLFSGKTLPIPFRRSLLSRGLRPYASHVRPLCQNCFLFLTPHKSRIVSVSLFPEC